jgi:2',3'-cyclic-nucleotide 2'-phosphodiesterase (5'-nucleotidase family)
MRKYVYTLVSVLLAMLLLIPSAVAGSLDGMLVILHTNDVHGHAVADTKNGYMGYAEIAQYKQDVMELGASVLLLDAGDPIMGMPIVNLDKGTNAITFMNLAGYDAMTLGNHEFDWGSDNLLRLEELAGFPFLSANVYNTADGTDFVQPNVIFIMDNGMKIGVFGLTTPETLSKANRALFPGLSFRMGDELFTCAQEQVDELEAAGVDLIVCLGHLGVDDESAGMRSTDVIEAVDGIDVFIDAHSHTVIDGNVITKGEGDDAAETLLVQAGSYGEYLGAVLFDGETLTSGLIPATKFDSAVLPLTALLPKHEDEMVAAEVNSVNDAIQAELSQPFAVTEVLLNGERSPGVRTEETNLGDFCCDAMLWAARQLVGDQVVASISNGGGIRASIAIGDVTMNDMKTVFPFGNTLVTLDVTGAELLEALEAATFIAPEAVGAFPQVAGIVFTVDTAVPFEQGEQYANSTYYAPLSPGSRVTIATVGGEAFDPDAMYTICTNNFTAAGGDTYGVFAYPYQQTGYDTYKALEDALVDYVTEVLGGTIAAPYDAPQGRITVK